MESKTRLDSYCTKRANNGVDFVTSRNINTRLARPITAIKVKVWFSQFLLINTFTKQLGWLLKVWDLTVYK